MGAKKVKVGSFKVLLLTLVIASVVVLALSFSFNDIVSALPGGPHDPIYIDGNAGFTPANGVTSGSGTENDPYIIENWDIDASSADGIELRNTTAHFIIRSCRVHGGGESNGIYLNNVVNGKIENNTMGNNWWGISLYFSSNITLDNNTCRNNMEGIRLYNTVNSLITNCIVENNLAYGIFPYYSDNNTFVNNTCENNSIGIRLEESDNNTLTKNTCENNEYGIYLFSSSNITLDNNTCSSNRYNFGVWGSDISHFDHDIDSSNLVDGRSIYYLRDHEDEVIGPSMNVGYLALVRCDNMRMENLALENNWQGILLASTRNSQVINCDIRNNGDGIYLNNSDNNLISNNTCENNHYLEYSDYHGIYLEYSDNNTFVNNMCENNNYGIFLYFSSNNTLDKNTCSNNTYGIYLNNSDNNLILNNTCENNKWGGGIGICTYNSHNNTFVNNMCENNLAYGIFLGYSYYNILSNNTCRGNHYRGIYLLGSGNNILDTNTCENNFNGIYLNNSDYNHIYHNNFVNNSIHTCDGGPNFWDDGYPSGGNYWDDYAGMDENHGPNQDIPGPDGIGDTPYDIPGGNQDRYPLMNPWSLVSSMQVLISPTSQEGVPGATLTYNVTVSNTGDIYDNYDLAASDNENWGPTLSENLLDNVGPDENRVITLSVTIPENATSFNEDNIRVTATSAENVEVSGSDWCIAQVQGKAEFDHITLYKVSLDVNLYGSGSKLVVKFYTWGDDFEGENVVWSGTTPDNVILLEDIPHPQGKAVEKVRLDLTHDNTENVISTLSTFTVRKVDLEVRFMEVPSYWAGAPPEGKVELEVEFMEVPSYWAGAPS